MAMQTMFIKAGSIFSTLFNLLSARRTGPRAFARRMPGFPIAIKLTGYDENP
jgi:hypothetical protein